jgi:putative transposase
MPRANRYFLPGHVWHITHRCHKKEFLLKFSKDRKRWRYWLYAAKKRYGLSILNFVITSNHIHLLVVDHGRGEIARSMQLIAGRTAQEYNQRKKRKGAFWEDRYHATAVDTDDYLARCMVYIDLNMVRAGVVSSPEDWCWSGYHEIQKPPQRYAVIDTNALLELFGVDCYEQYQQLHQSWIEAALEAKDNQRVAAWSQNIAVGSQDYLTKMKSALGIAGRHRTVMTENDAYTLKEPVISYDVYLEHEMNALSDNNTILLE